MSMEHLLADPVTGQPFREIAVFRALQLGDMLCATPALLSLRKKLPQARITLVSLPWAREFAETYSDRIDDFIEFPGFPGMPEREPDTEKFASFIVEMKKRRFDLAIQMHGSGVLSNSVISLFDARYSAGYFIPGRFCPDPERFLPHRDVTHEVWRWLSLLQFLGAPPVSEELDYPLSDRDFSELGVSLPEASPLEFPFVVIHPGARAAFRCWSAEGFAAVGDALAEAGYRIVLTGTPSERDMVSQVARRMRHPALDLSGRTSLKAMAALLAQTRLLICNDTGVSHLAVALKCPSVVVFTRSEFLGWPPLNRSRHRVVSRLNGPQVPDVLAQAMSLLKEDENATAENLHLARSRELSVLLESGSP